MQFKSDITNLDHLFIRTITKSDDCITQDAITMDNKSFYTDSYTIKYETI